MQSDWQSKKGAVPARQMCCADMWQLSIWGWLFQINSFPFHRLDFKPLKYITKIITGARKCPRTHQRPDHGQWGPEEPWKGIFCCVLPQNNFTTTIMFLQCLAVRLPHEEVPRPLFRPGSNFSWVEGGPDRVSKDGATCCQYLLLLAKTCQVSIEKILRMRLFFPPR